MGRKAVNRKVMRWVAIPVALGLCVASWMWPQMQGIATILLLLATFEYVLLTQENIELFRRQSEREQRVYVNFKLICRNGPLYIRVANLGISNFLISAIHVRTQDLKEFHYSTQDIIESGKTAELSLPREVCADHPLSVDLEITLECVGLDIHSKTEPQCFNVNMGLDEIPNSVKGGIDGLWSLTCPKCNKAFGGLLVMSPRGLKTFDEAFARKKEALKDLQDSCPNHNSKWLLQMDEAENQRRNN